MTELPDRSPFVDLREALRRVEKQRVESIEERPTFCSR